MSSFRQTSDDLLHKYSASATAELQGLIYTISNGNFFPQKIKTLIINQRADPNITMRDNNMTLLIKLSIVGQNEVNGSVFGEDLFKLFSFLLKRPDININIPTTAGICVIHTVATMNDPRFLSHLLANNLDALRYINIFSFLPHGKTALHYACDSVTVPIKNIENLLLAGANPNIKSLQGGHTPLQCLMIAYRNINDNILLINKLITTLKIFFENKNTRLGNLDLSDSNGCTLLHYAVQYIHSREVFNMILQKGEFNSINIHDNLMGVTPAQEAVTQNNTQAITEFWKYKNGGGMSCDG